METKIIETYWSVWKDVRIMDNRTLMQRLTFRGPTKFVEYRCEFSLPSSVNISARSPRELGASIYLKGPEEGLRMGTPEFRDPTKVRHTAVNSDKITNVRLKVKELTEVVHGYESVKRSHIPVIY